MKIVLAATLSFLALSVCAATPVLDPYDTQTAPANPTERATLWMDNSDLSYGMITKVDRKRMPSRKFKGYPYSVAVSPGKHTLKFFIGKISNPSSFDSYTMTTDYEVQIDVEAGHTYIIGTRNSIEGQVFAGQLIDLGPGKTCRYEVTGKMLRGYVPVKLNCI